MRHKKTLFKTSERKNDFKASLKKVFNVNFTLITAINFLVMTTYYWQFVTGAAYARSVYGLDLSTAGLSAGVIVLGCLAGRFASGNFISACGCRKMLFWGLLAYMLTIVSFFAISSLGALFVQRFLIGVCVGIVATATGTIIACIVPHEHHGFGIGIFSISTVLALAFGPFLGISLNAVCSYSSQMLLEAGLAAVCLPGGFLLRAFSEPCKWHRPLLKLTSYIDPRVALFSVGALLFCPAYGCVQVFMPGFAADRGLQAAASMFFVFYALAALATRPFTGRMYDRFGALLVLPPLFIIAIGALLLMAAAKSVWLLLLAAVLFGIGFGNYQSVGQSVAVSCVTRSRFSQATTTFFIFFDLGVGTGPYIFGRLVADAGYAGMFIGLSAMTFIALIYTLLEECRSARKTLSGE